MSLNASELFLLFMFSTKAEQNKKQKAERAANLANANFCPLALIPTCKFLSHRQTSKVYHIFLDLLHYSLNWKQPF